MTDKGGTKGLQSGETGAEVFERRRAAAAERQQRERDAGERRRADGQGVRVPIAAVSGMDRYMYDLHGYLVLKRAVGADELAAMNAAVDHNEHLWEASGTRAGGLTASEAKAMMADPDALDDGKLQHQGVADGAPGIGSDPAFDRLIAHPSWITHIKDFVAQENTVFTNGGGVVLRWPGQASGVHGGGEERYVGHKPGFGWRDSREYDETGAYVGEGDGVPGRFESQLCSVLLALNDSPIGGGNTAVVVSAQTVSSGTAS
jgi:hypothetical protein